MRGKEINFCTILGKMGITPAYAGKRLWFLQKRWCSWDHPRVCGEKTGILRVNSYNAGSPPRMRGKVPSSGSSKWYWGITPAYAGKRECPTEGAPAAGDHPRVCGEKLKFSCPLVIVEGSPPRMRGKVGQGRQNNLFPGITPAYAGKSCFTDVTSHRSGDHPRVCGEKW